MDPWYQNFKLCLSYWLLSTNKNSMAETDSHHEKEQTKFLHEQDPTGKMSSASMDLDKMSSASWEVDKILDGSSNSTNFTKDRRHVCPHCYKGFKSRQQLMQHNLVHSNLRKYQCNYCDKAFKQLSHVQQHHRIHTGERPYRCPLEGCDKAFPQLSNLQHHLRNHDKHGAGDEQYLCIVCNRGYPTEATLKSHTTRMHLHEKPEERQIKPQDDVPRQNKRKPSRPQHIYQPPSMAPLQPPSMAPLQPKITNGIHNMDIGVNQMGISEGISPENHPWTETRQESTAIQSNVSNGVENKLVNKRKRTIPLPKGKSKIMRLFSRGDSDNPFDRMNTPYMFAGQDNHFNAEKDALSVDEIQRAIATTSVSFSRSLENLAKQRSNMDVPRDLNNSKHNSDENQPMALNEVKDVGMRDANLTLPISFNHVMDRSRKFDQSSETLQRQLTNGQHRDINFMSQHVF